LQTDFSLTFAQQVNNWVKLDEDISRERQERAQKRNAVKQTGGGRLLARELKSLGITFDAMGNAILP
jgi:hypothetical protein